MKLYFSWYEIWPSLCSVNTYILVSFSGLSFNSAISQLGVLTFLNFTLPICKLGITLSYEGIMSFCPSRAPQYISVVTFDLYHKCTCPDLLEIQPFPGLPWPDVRREVKTNNSQWLWHCFLPLSWCPPWASGQAFSGWFFYWNLTTSGHHFGKFYIRTYCFKSLESPSCSFYLCNNGHLFRRTWELSEV